MPQNLVTSTLLGERERESSGDQQIKQRDGKIWISQQKLFLFRPGLQVRYNSFVPASIAFINILRLRTFSAFLD